MSGRIIELFDEFVEATAGGANGLEQRFAKKFAILYVAGRIGVESGLLPWPKDWPMRAVRHCYENSLRQRDPDAAETTTAVRRLARIVLQSDDRFPKLIVKRGRYPRWDDQQIGIRRVKGGKCETFLARDRLDQLCDPNRIVEATVFRRLCELGIVSQGDYALASEQMRVQLPNGEVRKTASLEVGRR